MDTAPQSIALPEGSGTRIKNLAKPVLDDFTLRLLAGPHHLLKRTVRNWRGAVVNQFEAVSAHDRARIQPQQPSHGPVGALNPEFRVQYHHRFRDGIEGKFPLLLAAADFF